MVEVVSRRNQLKSLLLEMSKAHKLLGDVIVDFQLPNVINEWQLGKADILQLGNEGRLQLRNNLLKQSMKVRDCAGVGWLKPILTEVHWPEAGKWFHSFHVVFESVKTNWGTAEELFKLKKSISDFMQDICRIASRLGADSPLTAQQQSQQFQSQHAPLSLLGFCTLTEAAKHYNLNGAHKERVRKALVILRRKDVGGNDWQEVDNRKRGEDQFRYKHQVLYDLIENKRKT